MKQINSWSFKKHILFSFIISSFVQIFSYLSTIQEQAKVIGIIGGADGPTVIFTANSNLSENTICNIMTTFLFLQEFVFIPVFILLLILYKPLRFMIERFLIKG